MAGLGLLVGIVGVVGWVLTLTGLVPALSTLPIPSFVWPVAAVAGLVLFLLTRRPAD